MNPVVSYRGLLPQTSSDRINPADCRRGERLCVNESFRLFNGLIAGDLTDPQDKKYNKTIIKSESFKEKMVFLDSWRTIFN